MTFMANSEGNSHPDVLGKRGAGGCYRCPCRCPCLQENWSYYCNYIAYSQTVNYLPVFLFPFEASKGNKNALIFEVPANSHDYLKKISTCRCYRFASWLCPFRMAKPKRLHKPKLEIFLHALRKSTSC
jgi:hypothetical protein